VGTQPRVGGSLRGWGSRGDSFTGDGTQKREEMGDWGGDRNKCLDHLKWFREGRGVAVSPGKKANTHKRLQRNLCTRKKTINSFGAPKAAPGAIRQNQKIKAFSGRPENGGQLPNEKKEFEKFGGGVSWLKKSSFPEGKANQNATKKGRKAQKGDKKKSFPPG